MPIPQITPPRRMVLSFSVESLTARDDLLLKSLVRVLDHRAHQQWESKESQADLRVTGAPYGSSPADGNGQPVLRMGYPPGAGEFGLPMPLNAGDLEQAFNRIGDQLAQQRATAVATAAQQPVRNGDQFRLRRWPPASMLGSAERRSLAALMSGRAQTVPGLQRLSGVPLMQCMEFLRDLRHADLVMCVSMTGTPSLASAGAGVVTQSAGSQAVRQPAAASSQPVQPGLLSRIRARFGLQPAWSR